MAGQNGGDSKDLIISQLMREINELRVNDADYTNINLQLSNLEGRYAQLKSEKVTKEAEMGKKHLDLMNHLAKIRSDVDMMKSKISSKEKELKHANEDTETTNQLIIQKKELLDQLNFEAEDLITKKEMIEHEHSSLRHDLNRYEAEKQELLTSLQTANNILEDSISRERELTLDLESIESSINNKSHSIESLRAEISEIESENDQLKSLIREKEFEGEELQSAVTCLESNLVADETEKRRMMDQLELANNNLAKDMLNNNRMQDDLNRLEGKIR